jgi:hypothetical protein
VCLYGQGPQYQLQAFHLSRGTRLEVDVNAYKPLRFTVGQDGKIDTSVRIEPSSVPFHGTTDHGREFNAVMTVVKGWPSPMDDHSPIPSGKARVNGVVYPGVLPPVGATIRFTRGSQAVDVAVMRDRFQIDLTPGTWTARSLDGRVCEPDINVNEAESSQVIQLMGRVAGCAPAK